jgi:hypothetical protein
MKWTKEQEQMVADLIDRLQKAPQRSEHVPGRGDPNLLDEYRLVMSAEERNMIMRALDFLDHFNRSFAPAHI